MTNPARRSWRRVSCVVSPQSHTRLLLVLSLVGAGAAWAPSAWAVDPPDLSLTSPNPTNGDPSLSWTPVLFAVTYTVERSDSTCASPTFTPIDELLLTPDDVHGHDDRPPTGRTATA